MVNFDEFFERKWWQNFVNRVVESMTRRNLWVSMIDWLHFLLYISRTKHHVIRLSCIREALDPSFTLTWAQQCFVSSIAPRVWSPAFQMEDICVSTEPPAPARDEQEFAQMLPEVAISLENPWNYRPWLEMSRSWLHKWINLLSFIRTNEIFLDCIQAVD